jgi:uncharacterized protein YgbK (DUF1537 family)
METDMLQQQPRRQADTSNVVVREALKPTLTQFTTWRSDLARLAVRAERRFTERDREAMLARCAAIAAELLAARTELLLELAEAPQRIAGHSRVADVENALDSIETALADVERRLSH